MLDWVRSNWDKPDEGVWEVRSERQYFLYSKLQCGVALDRGLRQAKRRSLRLDRPHLEVQRDRIFDWIMTKGWDAEKGCFVQAAGSWNSSACRTGYRAHSSPSASSSAGLPPLEVFTQTRGFCQDGVALHCR